MYKINKSDNRISRIQTMSFSELGFREREHLQEWLANAPEALDNDLLIIQKEFDGFKDTRERLDLLALDKSGNLVVIENKLDDTGRDVMWQALKYASYCSSLTKTQIIDIYQSYLDRYEGGGNAKAKLSEFFEVELDEVVLNSGVKQRIMFVAANFRKEVTSTALWLLSHGIQIQCFKVTPYAMGEELLLNVEQIIPTPEAEELMISMNAKEAEEKSSEKEQKNRHKLRLEFWQQCLEALGESTTELFNNISPSKDHWLSAGSGVRSCPFSLIFGSRFARVEFYMSKSSSEENKQIFDYLYEHKAEIEQRFGSELEWQRLEDKKACRVQFQQEFDGYNKDNWPEIIAWLVEHIERLEKAFKPALITVNKEIKSK
ncbi:DUF4268 domain-containing protein [Paraferrimonas sp. SM1919]|uniref:DUF4268 domain-containing protein n=1 Tax=Paraferrimonas sp. SM1919 TaxID=2662263 RepID=UPI0013CFECFE|nr:DUF4268 domain-containing protein [Paraferrimonas sp. SM1919]